LTGPAGSGPHAPEPTRHARSADCRPDLFENVSQGRAIPHELPYCRPPPMGRAGVRRRRQNALRCSLEAAGVSGPEPGGTGRGRHDCSIFLGWRKTSWMTAQQVLHVEDWGRRSFSGAWHRHSGTRVTGPGARPRRTFLGRLATSGGDHLALRWIMTIPPTVKSRRLRSPPSMFAVGVSEKRPHGAGDRTGRAGRSWPGPSRGSPGAGHDAGDLPSIRAATRPVRGRRVTGPRKSVHGGPHRGRPRAIIDKRSGV